MMRSLGGSTRSALRSRQLGFSLLELMVVVAITGVLAAVAIPAFMGYTRRSRTSEAVNFLGVIKLREESYRMEFGRYVGDGNTPSTMTWVPADATTMKNGVTVAWPGSAVFDAIGARPDGPVRFGYAVVAGTPADANTIIGSNPYLVPVGEQDFYFIAQATTDLDGNNTPLIMELTSFTRTIWVSAGKGWD